MKHAKLRNSSSLNKEGQKALLESSMEQTNQRKSKLSYLAKLFVGKKKTKRRKVWKKENAHSPSGTDVALQKTSRDDDVRETDSLQKRRIATATNGIENQQLTKKTDRVFFKRRCAKKFKEIGSISVVLSVPSGEESQSQTDLAINRDENASVAASQPLAKRCVKEDRAVANVHDKNNNSHSPGSTNNKETPQSPMYSTDAISRTNVPENERRRPTTTNLHYNSSTVGRRPIRRKNCHPVEAKDSESIRRAKSFSVDASATTVPGSMEGQSDVNGENLSAHKYANMCRASNQAFDSLAKADKLCKKDRNFLRWNSVGDMQRHIAGEKFGIGNSSDLKTTAIAKNATSVSCQNLSMKDAGMAKSPTSHEQVTKRFPCKKGKKLEHQRIFTCRHDSRQRYSLNKALSKSEANIWVERKDCTSRHKGILAFKNVHLPDKPIETKDVSPKRHSADLLDRKSSFECQKYSLQTKNSSADCNMPFHYNITENVLFGQMVGVNGNMPYSHTSTSDRSAHVTNPPIVFSTVAGGVTARPIVTSRANASKTQRSDQELRSCPADFSQDVGALSSKMCCSGREKPPPLPPKSTRLRSGANEHNSDDVKLPTFCYPSLLDSPHRVLPVGLHGGSAGIGIASYGNSEVAGVPRSRSRSCSIAKHSKLSGSTENLTSSSFALCTARNWNADLEPRNNNYWIKPHTAWVSCQSAPEAQDVVRRRHCPVLDVDRKSTSEKKVPLEVVNGEIHRKIHNKPIIATRCYPEVGETFYYGRRPISAIYPGKSIDFSHCLQGNFQDSHGGSGRKEPSRRPKVLYALDV